MRLSFFSPVRQVSFFACLVLVLAVITPAHATTHIIQFGGSLGDAYSPSSLTVSVGDTITWEGNFSAHPLSSTSVPTGAATFHNGSGTVFSYVVTVAGSYSYQCDIHFSLGMVGSFTAVTTGVYSGQASNQPAEFRLEQNFPNPFNPMTTIQFSIAKSSVVDLKIFDLLGHEVGTLENGLMSAGAHQLSFDASKLASGVYFYRLQAGSFVQMRKLVLLK